jgi:hypothetical protein
MSCKSLQQQQQRCRQGGRFRIYGTSLKSSQLVCMEFSVLRWAGRELPPMLRTSLTGTNQRGR